MRINKSKIEERHTKMPSGSSSYGSPWAEMFVVDESTIEALAAFDNYLTQMNKKRNPQQRTS
jgi:hypothetical protein